MLFHFESSTLCSNLKIYAISIRNILYLIWKFWMHFHTEEILFSIWHLKCLTASLVSISSSVLPFSLFDICSETGLCCSVTKGLSSLFCCWPSIKNGFFMLMVEGTKVLGALFMLPNVLYLEVKQHDMICFLFFLFLLWLKLITNPLNIHVTIWSW